MKGKSMCYLSAHLFFTPSPTHTPLLSLLFPNKNSIDFNYACGHKGIDLGRHHVYWWGAAHQRVQLVSWQKKNPESSGSLFTSNGNWSCLHVAMFLLCWPLLYILWGCSALWWAGTFPISLILTAAAYQKDVMIERQHCLRGKYYVQHVCVLSQGGALSDGRKGNRMYSYPL